MAWRRRGLGGAQPLRLALASLLAAWVGCLDSRGATLELAVRPVVGRQDPQLGSLRHETAAGERYSITRASYLLSRMALRAADGKWIELPGEAAWLDAELGRESVRLEAPPGSYSAIRFLVGLEGALNHADPATFPAGHALNPAVNHLHWSWQGGYIFMALEGNWRNGGVVDGWSFHLAGTGNAVGIELECALDLSQSKRVELTLDLGFALQGAAPISLATDGTSTHSREGDPLAAKLLGNLANAFRLSGISQVEESPTPEARQAALDLPNVFTPHPFRMGSNFPIPDLPKDNPLIMERVALGRKLFGETLLSRDYSISCATCHLEEKGFTDGRRVSAGIEGRTGRRNAMPLLNLAWKQAFFWDGRAGSLREQALTPIQDHLEMDETMTNVVRKLASAGYGEDFGKAFSSEEITAGRIGLALEQHLLTLTSHNSRFDRAAGGGEALSLQERRGQELFMTEFDPRRGLRGADCFHCHGGALFQSQAFANNGLGADPGDKGRGGVTGRSGDMGKFATPSLRNVALTAPYMHDGRFATLEEVVAHYNGGVARGGTLDPNLAKHPDGGLNLGKEDQAALVAFLKTLTDAAVERE